MADNSNTLSAKLEVRDSFTSNLNKFKTALTNTQTSYEKFVKRFQDASEKLEKTIDKIDGKVTSFSKKIITQGQTTSDSVISSTGKMEKKQQEMIENLITKYTSMGKNVKDIFKDIQKEANQINPKTSKISGRNKKITSNTDEEETSLSSLFSPSVLSNTLKSAIGGNFMTIATKLGVIGVGIVGVGKLVSTIVSSLDNLASQGFDLLNNISTGLLSINGLKEGVEDADKFEQNRVSMDMLYGGDENLGHKYYQMGVQSAKKTTYGEESTGELQKKLAGAHISYNEDQLNLLADVASLKPKMPLEHVGFSVVDVRYVAI